MSGNETVRNKMADSEVVGKVTYEKVKSEVKEQKPNTCNCCDIEFKDGEMIKYRNGKLLHDFCYKRVLNRESGRVFMCPCCKGTGEVKTKPDFMENLTGTFKASSECDICGGNGWTQKELVPIMKLVGYGEK